MTSPVMNTSTPRAVPAGGFDDDDDGIAFKELWQALLARWRLMLIGPLLAGLLSIGVTALMPPTFTARVVFMPPQQAQSGVSAALASLGQLGALAGGGAAPARGSVDQYLALMRSTTVSDRLIDEFKLIEVYGSSFRADARKRLAAHVQMSAGRKDGLITIDVDDKNPQRAATIANRYVDELRRLLAQLAITEAQQRRVFFEQQLAVSKTRLTEAQQALQGSGFNPGALKAEPRAAADAYAKLRAEVTAAEIRLQVTRSNLVDSTPEVQQQQRTLQALKDQLARLEASTSSDGGPDYISRYREFKYQETLFDLYARQFELARVDESRESALIQVIDPATPPERKSRPARGFAAVVTSLLAAFVLVVFVLVRHGTTPRPGDPA
jgi:uncharacterized protein involved in exopolysaccharide biosynthesis